MQNILTIDLNYILQNTLPLWNELRGKRIFLTGGTGFIGTWFIESLIWANDKLNLDLSIVVLTRNHRRFVQKAPHLATHPIVTFIEGDVKNFDFPRGEFTYIIHGATDVGNHIAPEILLDNIEQGTAHTLAFATAAQTKKFLFISSGAVYGKQPPLMYQIDESYDGTPHLFNPNATYGIGKRTAEHLCMLHMQKTNLDIKIARCFSFVGPYLPLTGQFAIGNFIFDRLTENPINIHGDGTTYRSYQYAADLIIWLLHILCNGQSCVPYNVGSDEPISLLELANFLAKNFTPQLDIKVAKSRAENTLPERYIPSVKRAVNEFGLTLKISLEDAIKKTIHWYKVKNATKNLSLNFMD